MKRTAWILPFLAITLEAATPNILLIVSDDQRPDTIAALGNPHIQTPNLDKLVARGTSFLNATCSNPICTPSRAEILTGCSGYRNGVLDFGGKIRPELTTLPRTLRDNGYHTWYVGKWHNNGRPRDHGYSESQGFYAGGGRKWYKPQEDWKGDPVTGYRAWIFQDEDGNKEPEKGVGLTPDISGKFADAAIGLIRRKPDKPFFLHVNFTAPHDPLLVPTGYADKYPADKVPLPENFLPEHPFDHGNFDSRDEKMLGWPRTQEEVKANLGVYYAVIDHMDREIGRIIAALEKSGQAEETVVIFTSDHGLAVGSHGLMGKQNMYAHTIRVPMVMAGPGIPEGKRTEALCYLRDLFPTLCCLSGIDIPCDVEGRSLVPLIQGKAESVYSAVYGVFRDKQRMVWDGRWKLIHYPQIQKFQLFDLASDPFEKQDKTNDSSHQETLQKLKAQLTQKFQEWESERAH